MDIPYDHTRPPRATQRWDLSRERQADMLRDLAGSLGKAATAAIFNRDVATIEHWLGSELPLDEDSVQRLVDAHMPFTMINGLDGAQVARAWFLGMNPYLNDDSPIERLATGNVRSVLAAAREHVNAG